MLRWLFPLCLFLTLATPTWALPESFAPIVKELRGKVVHIGTLAKVRYSDHPAFERFYEQFPQYREQKGLGSGMILSEDGYILTNNHVVEQAKTIEVTLFDGKKFKAKLIGQDKQTDLALLKIEAKKLDAVTLGDSDEIEIGDWVIAIGNPMGLDNTVTTGILSARGRDIFSGTAYGEFLQTDAAINPGNSGGPLFNLQGEVIGINTAIASGQGLGFAIPSNLAKSIIEQLKKHGKVRRGWLGVGIQPLDEDLAQSLGLKKSTKGIILTMVGENSPAEKSGLKQGDVILEANGKLVTKNTDLQRAVAETAPGGSIRLKVHRGKESFYKRVLVGERPSEKSLTQSQQRANFGMHLVAIDEELKRRHQLTRSKGLMVMEVVPGGIAHEKGIRKGDILIEANAERLESLKDFERILKAEEQGAITLLAEREGQPFYLALPRRP